MSADTPEKKNIGPEGNSEHSDKSQDKPSNIAPPIASGSDVPPSIHNTHTSKLKKKSSLEWGKFAVEVFTLVVISIYTVIAYHQWVEMRNATNAAKLSADVAQATLVASNRPWLDVRPTIVSPLTFDDAGAHITVQIETSNVGHSPAVRVSDSQEFIQVIIGLPDPWQEIKRLCQQAGGESAQSSNRGVTQTIFPGIPRLERWALTISPTEMKRRVTPGYRLPYIYPAIGWCVAYQADFSQVERHTGYVWELLMIKPKVPGGIGLIDPKKGPVSPENLTIVKYPFIGPLAD